MQGVGCRDKTYETQKANEGFACECWRPEKGAEVDCPEEIHRPQHSHSQLLTCKLKQVRQVKLLHSLTAAPRVGKRPWQGGANCHAVPRRRVCGEFECSYLEWRVTGYG